MEGPKITLGGGSAEQIRSAATEAQELGDWPRAAQLWEIFRALNPSHPGGYIGSARAAQTMVRFDEAEAILTAGIGRCRPDIDIRTQRAHLYAQRKRWADAEADWRLVCAAAPAHAGALGGLSRALIAQGKTSDAEAEAMRAISRHPDSLDISAVLAEIAGLCNDWPLAERHWRGMLERFGTKPKIVLGFSDSLMRQNCIASAELILGGAAKFLRDDLHVAEAFARCAERREDWSTAEQRWVDVGQCFPTSVAAAYGVAFARLKRLDLEGADEMAAAAVRLFPASAPILSLYAAVASQRRDWAEAERRWDHARRVLPRQAQSWLHQANARIALGRGTEAAALLQEALQLFPSDRELALRLSDLEVSRQNWAQASEVLQLQAAANPTDKLIRVRAFEAAWRATSSRDPEEALRAREIAAGGKPDAAAEIMNRFESLGDNTELAVVQRHFGAEPISLFRWAEVSTERLTAAFAQHLQGLGDPEFTKVDHSSDYQLVDRRFGLLTHTFIKEKQNDMSAFAAKQCARLRYLSREFLEELRLGEKIFVYKSASADPMPKVERLHAAMRQHGSARLLYVRVAEPGHPGGSLEEVRPGLMIGYLTKIFDQDTNRSMEVGDWLNVLQSAARLADGSIGSTQYARRELLLRFESMGYDCEFGYMQRHCGAEPVDWLRWSKTTLQGLAEMIELGLPGIGDPQFVEIKQDGDEYSARDTRFNFIMRTFIRGHLDVPEEFFAEQSRRTHFLRDQLLADIRGARRIFVHKTADRVPLDDIAALHGVIRSVGPARLLHVRPPEKEFPSGSLRTLDDGLLVGYLSGLQGRGGVWDPPNEAWLELCRQVLNRLGSP